MVLVAFEHIVVSPEALVALVVVVVGFPSCPSVALDTEMVVALSRQFTIACGRLQYALCQCDAGRDAVLLHLFDGQVLVAVKIFLKTRVPLHLCEGCEGQQ